MHWTVGFLLAANFAYALLGMVVGAIALTVSARELLELSKKMDLNNQIAGRYGDVAMEDFGKADEMVAAACGVGGSTITKVFTIP